MKNYLVFLPALLALILVLKLACLPAPDKAWSHSQPEVSTVFEDTTQALISFPYDSTFSAKKVMYFIDEIGVDEVSTEHDFRFKRSQKFSFKGEHYDYLYWISFDKKMNVEVHKATGIVTSVTIFNDPFDTSFRVYF